MRHPEYILLFYFGCQQITFFLSCHIIPQFFPFIRIQKLKSNVVRSQLQTYSYLKTPRRPFTSPHHWQTQRLSSILEVHIVPQFHRLQYSAAALTAEKCQRRRGWYSCRALRACQLLSVTGRECRCRRTGGPVFMRDCHIKVLRTDVVRRSLRLLPTTPQQKRFFMFL